MGRGRKNKGGKHTSNSHEMSQQQQMSERNVVQEEGFESDDEKNSGKSSMVKVDLRGSDSEEDNAAAGGGLVSSRPTEAKDRKNLHSQAPTNLHKKKNKASSPTTDRHTHVNSSTGLLPMPTVHASSTLNCSTATLHQDPSLNYDNLGHIVVRLLPAEYQAERLPDGRYIMKAAAIGYLAQKLGH